MDAGDFTGDPTVPGKMQTEALIEGMNALGYKVALVTSSVSMAALAAARTMLLELKNSGRQDNYFAGAPGFDEVRRWYRDLGFRPTKPFE